MHTRSGSHRFCACFVRRGKAAHNFVPCFRHCKRTESCPCLIPCRHILDPLVEAEDRSPEDHSLDSIRGCYLGPDD
jgi:hypothetical protein